MRLQNVSTPLVRNLLAFLLILVISHSAPCGPRGPSRSRTPEEPAPTPEAAQVFIAKMSQWERDYSSLSKDLSKFYTEWCKDPLGTGLQELTKRIQEFSERFDRLEKQLNEIKPNPAWAAEKASELDKALKAHAWAQICSTEFKEKIATLKKDAESFPELARISKELIDLNQRLDILAGTFRYELTDPDREKKRMLFSASLKEIASKRQKLWEQFQEVSLYFDRRETPLIQDYRFASKSRGDHLYGYSSPLWTRANPVAEAFANLRDRLIGLRSAWGLDAAEKRGGVGINPEAAKFREFDKHWAGVPVPAPSGFALARHFPLVGPLMSARALQLEETGWQSDPRRKPDEQEKIAVRSIYVLRSLGLTRTHGDPDGWRNYVHEQHGQTCAIASQICMLRIAKATDKTQSPSNLETQLFDQAVHLGIWGGDNRNSEGMPVGHLGSFLTMRGLPALKYVNAKPGQLNASLRRGPVLVSVDAGIFYNDHSLLRMGHALLVTALEESVAGEVLAYYVNDTRISRGGMLIPAQQFLKAWKKRGSVYVQPQ